MQKKKKPRNLAVSEPCDGYFLDLKVMRQYFLKEPQRQWVQDIVVDHPNWH